MLQQYTKQKILLLRLSTRTISILPLLPQLYEISIFKQLSVHANKFLSQILRGFRNAHSTQQALLRLLQPWQKELDNSGCVVRYLWAF